MANKYTSILCPPRRPWHLDAVIYQVYPQSFYDTNGDGIGDINGVTEKLDYISYLGADAVWLTPIFESPFTDAGYDVSDYRKIAPRYGTLGDFRRLIREAHRRGIRILLDLVYGHTSDQHPWFRESRKFRRNKYSNWYLWSGKEFGGGKWVWNNEGRHEMYYASWNVSQVDLNYGFRHLKPGNGNSPRDPGIRRLYQELRDIVRYWLDLGVDGFRCDATGFVGHKACGDDDLLPMLFWQSIRRVADRFGDRMLMSEEWDRPLEAVNEWGMHLSFSLLTGDLKGLLEGGKPGMGRYRGDPADFDRRYAAQAAGVRDPRHGLVLFTSNHDHGRLADNAGGSDDLTALGFLMVLTQDTVPKFYMGDEIGMRYDRNAPSHEGSGARAGARTPMQWSAERNAGFSTAPAGKLYLPVTRGYASRNVDAQAGRAGSLLEEVRRIIAVRRAHPALRAGAGKTTLHARKNDPLYAYARHDGRETVVVALNLSSRSVSCTIDAGKLARGGSFALRAIASKHGTAFAPRWLGRGAAGRFALSLGPYGWHILEAVAN